MEDYQRTFVTRNGLIFNCLAGAYFMSILVTASTCKCVCSLSQGNCQYSHLLRHAHSRSKELIPLKHWCIRTRQHDVSSQKTVHTDCVFHCCSSCIQDTVLSRGSGGSLQWTTVPLELLAAGCAICCDICWSCNTHHISVGTSSYPVTESYTNKLHGVESLISHQSFSYLRISQHLRELEG
jgi:hypothetical protein